MTGFSSQWLALREPTDHRARNAALCAQVTEHFKRTQPGRGQDASQPLRIMDLGCGSGSNLRALAPVFPAFQHWTLVDYDLALLQAARQTLIAWADEVVAEAPAADDTQVSVLICIKNTARIEITFLQVDLAANIEQVLARPIDLVTAAAFFDLVSPSWLQRFCAALTVPLYTVLTYDGVEQWRPAHSADADVLHAFHAHQSTDKGFGRSAGPQAIELMRTALTARGFSVALEQSPWELGTEDRELMRALARGTAGAVSETKTVDEKTIQSWLSDRLNAEHCVIGHWDLFAQPE
jgi:SAM-dependent methyltransferase